MSWKRLEIEHRESTVGAGTLESVKEMDEEGVTSFGKTNAERLFFWLTRNFQQIDLLTKYLINHKLSTMTDKNTAQLVRTVLEGKGVL